MTLASQLSHWLIVKHDVFNHHWFIKVLCFLLNLTVFIVLYFLSSLSLSHLVFTFFP